MIREQPTHVLTGKVKKRFTVVAALLLILGLTAALYAVIHCKAPYVPPAFDKTARAGIPDPPKNMNYGEVSLQGSFSFSIVGVMYQQKDGSLCLYLTNPKDSGINLMCEVKTENGDVIYKSGAIRPNEYVEKLAPLKKLPQKATKIELRVYAFEKGTWYSKGSVTLANTLQPY